MRISDWSSDVCSSDLAVADQSGKLGHLIMGLALEYCANADEGAKQAAAALGMEHNSVDGQFDSERQLNQFEQQIARGTQAVMLHAQIGRASCRERVCQSV